MIQKTIQTTELEEKRKQLLNFYKTKQPFRVATGKSKWIQYTNFNAAYNLREILDDEIVIEFDNEDRNLTWTAINFTAINLLNAGYSFEIWNHEGKSPHLHIHNLAIPKLEKKHTKKFKEAFVKTYTPKEYHKCVDFSLCGCHLIALEWAKHWKGCYEVKKLLNTWGKNDKK